MKKVISFLTVSALLASAGAAILPETFSRAGQKLTNERAPQDKHAINVLNRRAMKANTPQFSVFGNMQARIAAYPTYADTPVLYAQNHHTNDGNTTSKLGPGVFMFHPGEKISFQCETPDGVNLNGSNVFYAQGKYYVLTSATEETPATAKVYDATTWEVVKESTDLGDVANNCGGFRMASAYMPGTEYAYIFTWGNLDFTTWKSVRPLLRLNINTLEMETVGDVNAKDGENKFFQIAFCSNDGKLYGIEYTNSTLWEVDVNTAEPTKIGVLDHGLGEMLSAISSAGVVDPVTNICYLPLRTNITNTAALFTLDLNNLPDLTLRKVADLPGGEHFVGMYIPSVDADAPAATTGNVYADGNVKFTVPTTTYTSRKALSGDLTAVVTVDGQEQTKNVTAGENVAIPMTLADGQHHVRVYIRNAAGNGAERRYNAFVGTDLPCTVNNVNFTIEQGMATLTWEKPTETIYHGPVDDDAVRYDVVRMPDNIKVAEEQSKTSFTETLPTSRKHYWYVITPVVNGDAGMAYTTSTLPSGNQYVVPFEENFLTQDDFDQFKVVDANNDKQTWFYMESAQEAYLSGNGITNPETGFVATNNDDYLISLPIQLKAGVDYRVNTTYKEPMYYESIKMYISTSRTPDDAKKEIAEYVVKWGDENNLIKSHVFNVDADGTYYLMIYDYTVGNSAGIELKQIAMEIESEYDAPAAVNNLTATAGAMGALTNTISFTAPTTTYKNASLNDISRIEILRDGVLVHTINNAEPGKAYEWEDTDVDNGLHTYKITPYNSNGQGHYAKVTNWVGVDIPKAPANIKARMTSDIKPEFTWDATTAVGEHGGYVNTDNVKYAIAKYSEYSWDNRWPTVKQDITATTIVDDTYISYSSEEYPSQEYAQYAIIAYNDMGSSELGYIDINLGHPFPRPFVESFDFYGSAMPSMNPWTLHTNSYYYAWEVVSGEGLPIKPYDKDAGMLCFTRIDDDSNNQWMEGPRVSLKSAESPELSFFVWHGSEADEGDLQLFVYAKVDDGDFKKIMTVDYNNGINGWARHSVALPADADNVILGFGANAYDASASLFVDKIMVAEGIANDLSLEQIKVDKRVEKGQTGHVAVRVANFGQNDSGAFQVMLMRDNEEFAVKDVENLAVNSTRDITFDVPTAITDGGKSFSFTAKIVFEKDNNADNNLSDAATMYVTSSILPAINDLTGAPNAAGTVELAWTMPSNEYIEDVTDTFEDYEAFIIDEIGDWTTYDGDGSSPVYFGGPAIPHAFEAQAWQIWNPELAGFSLDKFAILKPHSGNQYIANWAASDGSSSILENDDWLISCEVLSGSDVSFWTCVPNEGSAAQKYEILYSTTDAEPENFQVLDTEVLEGTTEWQYHIYTLPAEAKYFAIRSCGAAYVSRTVWFIDDLNYTPAFGTKGELECLGYNIYRNNELIATVTEPAFQDTTAPDGTHSYYVTVKWNKGESLASNAVSATSGVEGVATLKARITTAKGVILASGLQGAQTAIYTMDGKCIFNADGRDNIAVNVVPGVYLVRVAGGAVKVIVK